MDKIQEAYNQILLNEANEENIIKKAIEKVFDVRVKKIEEKRKFTFYLSDFIDNGDFDNLSKVDAVEEVIEKKIKNPLIEWKGRTIEVEEL